MKVLLVYPDHPDTFWSFKHALKFISKKATEPPMGLLTVASMLPSGWDKRLIDMKVQPLCEEDIKWADCVFIGGMSIQRDSARGIIERCRSAGKRIVGGGPLFTTMADELPEVDHLIIGEAEGVLPQFIADLENGRPQRIYRAGRHPDMRWTPPPLWDLIDIKQYSTMDIQYSRGCPFNCEFCDVIRLYGRRVRTKSVEQVLMELDLLYERGWRGGVFFVDDNFIGNRQKLKKRILPAMIDWMENHRYPFSFATEASINLADDDELLRQMTEAGFNSVFIGIESPNSSSLAECNKLQNVERDLVGSVRKIQDAGLMVKGGFILGFDNDPPGIFNHLVEFIHESRIVNAMIGLLNAPKGTRLYRRLENEKRLLGKSTGNNTDFTINFNPVMGLEQLLKGYRETVQGIYTPAPYYKRVMGFLKEYRPVNKGKQRLSLSVVKALSKTIIELGFKGKERRYYWKLFLWTLFRRPRLFPLAVTLSVYGFHFRKIYDVVP